MYLRWLKSSCTCACSVPRIFGFELACVIFISACTRVYGARACSLKMQIIQAIIAGIFSDQIPIWNLYEGGPLIHPVHAQGKHVHLCLSVCLSIGLSVCMYVVTCVWL